MDSIMQPTHSHDSPRGNRDTELFSTFLDSFEALRVVPSDNFDEFLAQYPRASSSSCNASSISLGNSRDHLLDSSKTLLVVPSDYFDDVNIADEFLSPNNARSSSRNASSISLGNSRDSLFDSSKTLRVVPSDDFDEFLHNRSRNASSISLQNSRDCLSFISSASFLVDMDEESSLEQAPQPLRNTPMQSPSGTVVEDPNLNPTSSTEPLIKDSNLNPIPSTVITRPSTVGNAKLTKRERTASLEAVAPLPPITRGKRNPWIAEEDDRLRTAVKQQGLARGCWSEIAKLVRTRSATSCSQRWHKCLRFANLKTGKWSPDEDAKLHSLVREHGIKGRRSPWEAISRGMGYRRSHKQCRDRWQKFQDPAINTGEWTTDEDAKLIFLFKKQGSKWSKMAKQLHGRTAHHIQKRLKVLLQEVH